MPIYEYRCAECGHHLEQMQKISDPPLIDCPVCGQPALKKQISAAGFRLKGSGWYETDFKKGNKKNLHDGGETGGKSGGGDTGGGAGAGASGTASGGTGASGTAGGDKPASAPAPKPAA